MFGLRYLHNVATLRLEEDRCTGCGRCHEVCPHAVLALGDGKVRIADLDACMECGACERNCPEDAIHVRAGVGCAMAIINAALGRRGDCCCVAPADEGGKSPRAGCC